MRVAYSSNNSGGSWWLKDADWLALEAAGWAVEWGREYFCHSKNSYGKAPKGKPEPCTSGKECYGHPMFSSASEMTKKDRFLGSLASAASKEFASFAEGIREWERVTGKDASEEGCNCCGAPHSFSTDGTPREYASGDGVVEALYGRGAPKSLREAAERLK